MINQRGLREFGIVVVWAIVALIVVVCVVSIVRVLT